MVIVSAEAGQPTVKSQNEARRAALEVGVRADPLVKAVLERFPGAAIVGVREPDNGKTVETPSAADEPDIPLPDDSGFGDNWERDE